MTTGTGTLLCPKGHASTEPDYCSECGAKIAGSTGTAAEAGSRPAPGDPGQICPDCGTVREQNDIAFCEVCGYNFTTGAHGEVGIVDVASAPALAVAPLPAAEGMLADEEREPVGDTSPTKTLRWNVWVSVDPSLKTAESPEPPLDAAPFSVELQQSTSLIGRVNEARGIFPEITASADEAVSRRHALLQRDADGNLLLRDIGSANGTRLNGKDLQAMQDYPVHEGDEITLGHWTRMRVTRTAEL